jgi:hypothetical protein
MLSARRRHRRCCRAGRMKKSRIRKRRAGAGWSRICKVFGGKDEERQWFRGLGLEGLIPGTQGAVAPVVYPPSGGKW